MDQGSEKSMDLKKKQKTHQTKKPPNKQNSSWVEESNGVSERSF